jgi:hypothetical protein
MMNLQAFPILRSGMNLDFHIVTNPRAVMQNRVRKPGQRQQLQQKSDGDSIFHDDETFRSQSTFPRGEIQSGSFSCHCCTTITEGKFEFQGQSWQKRIDRVRGQLHVS